MRAVDNRAGVLHGFEAIGKHFGVSAETARYRANREGMPLARSGRRVWITRETLDRWIAEREAAAMAGRAGKGGR